MAGINPCFCISLRTGSLIIAILEIILSVLGAAVNILGIGGLIILQKLLPNNATINGTHSNLTAPLHDVATAFNEPADIGFLFTVLYMIFSLMCLVFVVQIIISSVLIHGIRKERPVLLKLWLIFRASCLVLGVVLMISSVFIKVKGESVKGNFAVDALSNLLSLYFLYVVYLLYKEMRNSTYQRPKPKYESYG